jgi:hypothetical protein
MMGQAVSIKGNGAEHVGGVEGAVDRIAVEILHRLEQGRTLVIWAFDASGSLQAERQRLSKHIETIYTHITQLDENHLSADKGLLTLVVAFGQDRKAMTPKPTAELSEILEAMGEVPTDETGVESTFTTVAEIIRRWGHYKDSAGQVYHPMIIVVTDEVGDDENRLEESIELAQRSKVPVHVLGSQALFGRVEGYMDYVDPKTKHVFQGVAVRQGPESGVLEQIRLPFWYDGPPVRHPRGGVWPLCSEPPGQRNRWDLLRDPVHRAANGVRSGPDEGVQARLGPARPVRGGDCQVAPPPGGHQRRADYPATVAGNADFGLPCG